jgi:ribA/ribD-fused uncharacterized protein
MEEIKFFKGEFEFLSNFYPCRIEMDGNVFPSSEHAYMSCKSLDLSWVEYCTDPMNSPNTVKRKSRTIELRSDWDEVRILSMEKVLYLKFIQEPFYSKLLNTGDKILIEGNHWHDNFFGSCICEECGDVGKNHLGKSLMKLREFLRYNS